MGKDLHFYLQEYFGYEAFRPGQAAIISQVLSGQSVLGLMATGGESQSLISFLPCCCRVSQWSFPR